MSYVKGVDVSSFQSPGYSTAGLGFAFVKATQGQSYTNPEMTAEIATAEKAKLVVGLYHFMQPGDSVTAQLAYFKSHAPVKPGYLIVVDWEGLNGAWPSNADKDALIKGLKAAYPHNRVGLYTNKDGWIHHDSTSYCGDFLWIATVGDTPGNPSIQHPWTFHQYGESKGTDLDVANFQTVTALKTWAGYPASAPAPVPPTVQPQAYKDVMLADVFPVPEGHDGGGNAFWTVQTLLGSAYAQIDHLTKTVETMAQQIADIHAHVFPPTETADPNAK